MRFIKIMPARPHAMRKMYGAMTRLREATKERVLLMENVGGSGGMKSGECDEKGTMKRSVGTSRRDVTRPSC